ncbi:3-hydroxyacyl-CoA dehydrogenase family protein [Spiractinospora alimapuensis]|uniref:3-hydroxyacyl-CoA dehydrogenase family protein n=1 Tax=Spiractinospora alimapuensis TaxID=2820884 RepID=UPI001F46A378|nr:3-hydroxyacyl-CoA dehydrogenase family protein [Spiractinospora alimapuensis]QVQ52476.1 3-hydroxyacyl-CoA dehydrogenase family protein [Spiractinospora alimapuensis]
MSSTTPGTAPASQDAPTVSGDAGAHRLAVLGAGTMGTGIATLAVGHGVPVVLVDVDAETVRHAETKVRHQSRMAQLMGSLPTDREPGELTTATAVDAVKEATVVVEAVTETNEAKAAALGGASAAVAPGTVLVTNTSGLPLSELAAHVARPAELLGTHFMNPPYLIRTVEVVRGDQTGQAAMDTLRGFLDVLERQHVVVRDSPGFVTSRLLHPMINTAARIVESGTATAADVDTLMRGCLGHPTGPLRTGDMIGLDNLVDSLWALHARTGDDACRPCDLLQEMVRDGKHGRKSGRGFYDYAETETLA